MTSWTAAGVGIVACAAIALMWLRRRYVVVSVAGESMVPNFRHGDRVLVRRTAGRPPETGEVAVLRLPLPGVPERGSLTGPRRLGRTRWAIKRIAALPGDPVPEPVRTAVGSVSVVPEGMLVLLGDNPAASSDSRAWGFIPAADLLGKVVSRFPAAAR